MNQNHNTRHNNRQGRGGQNNRPNQNNNQKRHNKSRQNQNRNPQPNTPNRQMDSRGPAGNQRGNAKQLYEKYKTLAQEKRAKDRLESEALSQHADHYYRIYAEFAAVEAAAQIARDKERAKKTQADAERRANAVVNDAPQQPRPVAEEATADEPKVKEDIIPVPSNLKTEIKTEEKTDIKTEEKIDIKTEEKTEIKSKAKEKDSAPKKKIIRKPRQKKLALDLGDGEQKVEASEV